MARPPAASESGEHSLDSIVQRGGGRAPRRRRDSGDRISFDSIARLVQPSMPPRDYDSLTPVSEADLSPPAVPGAERAPRRRRRGRGLAFKLASAIAAVALGAGLSWALRTHPSAQADHAAASGAATPASPTPASTAAAVPSEAAEPGGGPVVELEPQVLPAEGEEGREEATPDVSAEVDDEPRGDRADRERRSDRDRERADRREERLAAEGREERGADAHEARSGAAPAEPSASPAEPAVAEPTVEAPAVADGNGAADAPADEGAAAELPVQPTREQVQATMAGVLPALRECAGGQSGTVQVEVTAGSSGRVRNALVSGAFAGTPEGSCMARAVRGARFPRFSRESFTVRYPFRL